MTKKRALPPDRIAECTAAHELFLAKKNRFKLSQKKIAEMAGITPAAVNLYFKGINPLNAQFAAVLSRALGEPVERFSKRLAKEIADMASAVQSPSSQGSFSSGDSGGHADRAEALMDFASPRTRTVLERINQAARDGRLSEADLDLLDQITARFEHVSVQDTVSQGSHRRLRDRLQNDDSHSKQ